MGESAAPDLEQAGIEELRRLALLHGVPANQTMSDLRRQLRDEIG